VSFREFCDSPDYMGLSGLYEFWKKELNPISDDINEILFDGSLGTGKCIPGHCRVASNHGYQPIEYFKKLVSGDKFGGMRPINDVMLMQHNGTDRATTHFYEQSKCDVVNLHLSNKLTVSGTQNHKIQTMEGPMMATKDWTIGDLVPLNHSIMFYGQSTICSRRAFKVGVLYKFAVLYGYYGSLTEKPGFELNIVDNVYRCTDPDINAISYLDILNESVEVRVAFLKGLVSNKGLKIFTSESRDFVSALLTSLGIVHKAGTNSITVAEFSKQLFLDFLKGTPTDRIKYSDKFYYVIDNKVCCKIEYVTHTVEDVYDFVVPSTHRFVAQGVLNHNTTASNAFLLYRLYKLFLNGDPRYRLGIMDNSPVYIIYFSVSLKMAEKSGYKQLKSMIDHSTWFKNNAPRDKALESVIKLPYDFEIDSASAEGHQIGLNVWAFILDEANFRSGTGSGLVEEYEEVTQLYQQLVDRQITRFMTREGMNTISILISSASYQSSFMEKRKRDLEGEKSVKIITSVGYKIKPEKYSKEMFEVFVGTTMMSPIIIKDEHHKRVILRQLHMEDMSAVSDKFFEKVPESLRKQYELNINLALQNHSGVATQSEDKFVHNMDLVRTAYVEDIHPWFINNIVTLSNKDDVQLIYYLQPENMHELEKPHSIFLDLSISGDAGGLSCTRFDGIVNGVKKHTHVFTLEIVPPPYPGETKISKIKDFIVMLAEIVNLSAFGSDQYQSKGIRQEILAELDLVDTRLSIDSSDEFFLLWIRALVEERFQMLFIKKLETEIEEAKHDLKRRRITRNNKSTDDLFQSLVGSFFLSETVSSLGDNDIGSLYRDRINLVGGNSVRKMMRSLGFS